MRIASATAEPVKTETTVASCVKPSKTNVYMLLMLLTLFIVEFAIYQHYFLKFVSPFCPVNADQLSTYLFAYEAHLIARQDGVWSFLLQPDLVASAVPMKGVLVPWLAYAFTIFNGCTRWPVGCVNFIFFCIAQASIVLFVNKHRGVGAGIISLGLFLAAGTHYHVAGGINDLRLDYAGMVLMGLCFISIVSAVHRSSLHSLVLVAVTLMAATNTRSILLFYWCVTLPFCIVIFHLLSKFWRVKFPDAESWRNNTLWIGSISIFNLLIYFGLHWESFRGYYLNCKASGEDVERSRWDGVTNFTELLTFYARSFMEHFRFPIFAGISGLAGGYVISRFFPSSPNSARTIETIATVIGASLIVTVFAITSGYAPSPVVMGVLLIPICVCVSFLIHFQLCKLDNKVVEFVLATAILIFGGFAFCNEMLHPNHQPHPNRLEGAKFNKILDDLVNDIQTREQNTAMTWLLCHGDINYVTLALRYYEHGNTNLFSYAKLRIVPVFPRKEKRELLELINGADLVIVPLNFPRNSYGCFDYAGMRALKEHHPEILSALARSYSCVRKYDMGDWSLGVFKAKSRNDLE